MKTIEILKNLYVDGTNSNNSIYTQPSKNFDFYINEGG